MQSEEFANRAVIGPLDDCVNVKVIERRSMSWTDDDPTWAYVRTVSSEVALTENT